MISMIRSPAWYSSKSVSSLNSLSPSFPRTLLFLPIFKFFIFKVCQPRDYIHLRIRHPHSISILIIFHFALRCHLFLLSLPILQTFSLSTATWRPTVTLEMPFLVAVKALDIFLWLLRTTITTTLFDWPATNAASCSSFLDLGFLMACVHFVRNGVNRLVGVRTWFSSVDVAVMQQYKCRTKAGLIQE